MSRWRMSTSPGISSAGALVGRNAGSIIDSSATGAVSGTEATGGLVGAILHPGGVIVGSTAGVQVTGSAPGLFIGGLAGFNKGLIIDSHATGDVTGFKWVGGLVGSNNGAGGVNRISGSTASGAVTGTGDYVGGLVGWNNGPIIDSHATGDVSGVKWVGGLVGSNHEAGGTYQETRIYKYGGVNKISGSTASGAVTGTSEPGRWIGRMEQRPDQQQPCHRGRVWYAGGWRTCGVEHWSPGRQQDKREHGRRRRDRDRQLCRWIGRTERRPDQRQPCHRGREWCPHSVGGLVGTNFDEGDYLGYEVGLNAIRGSTASGAVIGTGVQVGGLVGYNEGPISDSDARGSLVRGYSSVGGLVGKNDGPGPISDSHARGSVQGLM